VDQHNHRIFFCNITTTFSRASRQQHAFLPGALAFCFLSFLFDGLCLLLVFSRPKKAEEEKQRDDGDIV